MTQPWPIPPPVQPHRRTAITPAAVTGLLALAALIVAIVALVRPSPRPDYTAAEKAAAQAQLCDNYKLASRAAHIETAPDGDTALARISMINGALMLETAARDPALAGEYRDAARALAAAYQNMAATGSLADPAKYQVAIDATNAKVGKMEELCGE
ncbi:MULTISPECIES: hypothetical protein [Mycobacteriaceae]|uniref:Alanine and proline rich membrane protein n=1 Tax=Mycolicibacter algericus DSM 45454 TaxID=723879 RepID=A0ABX3RXJ1_MYCAL|nr:hypothetical protein [Mycolicibacter algericus]OQZ98467.1 hypothetical protein BST10_06040 [Mycolicibacter algericus DSM 45454]